MTSANFRATTLASYLCVGFLQFVLLYPLHTTMDLPTWDEPVTMGQGEQFLHGGTLGALSDSPACALLYSVFVRAFGTVDSIFYMQYFVKISVSLLLLLFLSTHLRSHLLALLLTMIWLVSRLNLMEGVLVYHVAMGVFLLALVCLKRYQVLALMLLCLCALIRLEYLFAAVGFAGYAIWKSRTSERSAITISQLAVASLPAMLSLYVLFNLSDSNVGGKRTWFAFNQNYSVHAVEDGRYHLNPYIDSNIVIQADFPGATSLTEAFSINPGFFTKHVARNVAKLPRAVLGFAVPYSKRTPAGLFALSVEFAITVLTLASAVNKRCFKRVLGVVRHRNIMLYATFISVMTLMPILLVYPLPHHTLIMVPFLLFWPGLVCLERLNTLNIPDFTPRVLIVLNVLFALCIVLSGKPYASRDRPRPVLAQIRQLMELWPKERLKLMGVGSSWYAGYIGSQKVEPIEPLATVYGERIQDGSNNLFALIKRYNPDVILINSELTASKNFRVDSLAALSSGQWARCSVGSDSFYFRAAKINIHFNCSSRAE